MGNYFVDRFFKMEQEHNLFSLRDINGLPVWDIVRFDIYLNYTFSTESNRVKQSVYNKFLVALVGVLRVFLSILHLLFVKREVLIMEHPRYKKGKYEFDAAIQDFIDCERNNFISVSSYKALQKFDHFIEYDFQPVYFKLFFLPRSLQDTEVDAIQSALKSISLEPVTSQRINHIYNVFLSEYQYYQWYLRLKKPRRIIVNRDSTKKGLIAAANRLNIPIYEVQHGMFTKNHLIYSYPSSIDLKIGDIVVPTALFTFDSYWGADIRVPFRVVPTGNTYFSFDESIKTSIESNCTRNKLLIISSKVHAHLLTQLVSEYLRETRSETDIVYKLHPNEYSSKQFYEQYFAAYSNVKVVADETKMSELLIDTKLVVLINSTVFYEALNYGIPVAVFRRMNFDSYITLFNKPNVFSFDTIEEFINLTTRVSPSEPMSFFKQFDKSAYFREVDNCNS